MKDIRVVFIGMPEMGIVCLRALAEAKKNIVGLIPPPKQTPGLYNTMSNLADNFGIPVIDYEESLDEPDFIERVKALNADIGVVASYSKKFPKELLEATKLGFVNSHPSLLPHYRGGNPYFHPINNNEKVTGVTLHLMDEDFDTGDIVFQQTVPIIPFETMGTLFNRTNYMFANAQIDLINHLETGGDLPRSPQDKEGEYIKAPMVHESKGHNRINWNMPCDAVERFIRACNPFFIAATSYKGNLLKIHTGFFDVEKIPDAEPGTITEVGEHHMGVATSRGTFYPRSLQIGSYFAGDIGLFLAYIRPQVGEKLV